MVFLGDVGLEEGQLTEEQCRLLKGLVQRQASGLVFMPGWKGHQLCLAHSPLSDLMPILFDDKQPEGWGSRTPSHFELTELGVAKPFDGLADSAEDNLIVWENLPGFQWHAPVLRAKAGSDTLAVHQVSTSAHGRVPLLVTKLMVWEKSSSWEPTGRGGGEREFEVYHYRFWGTSRPLDGLPAQYGQRGKTCDFITPLNNPMFDRRYFLNSNVTEKNGEPLQKGDVTARIVSPWGLPQTIRLERQGEEWGAFSNKFIQQELAFIR